VIAVLTPPIPRSSAEVGTGPVADVPGTDNAAPPPACQAL